MSIEEVNQTALKYRSSEDENEKERLFERLVDNFEGMIYRYTPEVARYKGTNEDCRQEMLLQMYVFLNEKWDPARASFCTGLHWAFRKGIRDYRFQTNLIKFHFGIPKKDAPSFIFASIDRPIEQENGSKTTDSYCVSKFSWEDWENLQDVLAIFDKLEKKEKAAILRHINTTNKTNRFAEAARDRLRDLMECEKKGKFL